MIRPSESTNHGTYGSPAGSPPTRPKTAIKKSKTSRDPPGNDFWYTLATTVLVKYSAALAKCADPLSLLAVSEPPQ